MPAPHLIAIAGASCSGKTTLADALAHHLQAAQVALDSYYYDLSHLGEADILQYNLDEPAALEDTLLVAHLRELRAGRAIDKPIYEHKTHTRRPAPERVEPGAFVVIEGLFALYWEDLRGLVDTKVFMDSTHELCFERRFRRDRNKRGRTREEVTKRYNDTVAPMYDRYVLPTRGHADVIVNGADPISTSVLAVLEYIKK